MKSLVAAICYLEQSSSHHLLPVSEENTRTKV